MAFTSPASSSSMSTLEDKRIDMIFFKGYEEIPRLYEQYLSEKKSTTAWNEYGKAVPLGNAGEIEEGAIPIFDAPDQYSAKRVTNIRIGKGFAATEKIYMNDVHGILSQLPDDLSRAVRYTIDVRAARPFNFGFVTTYFTAYDGYAMFHTAHVLKDGNTYGNRPATDVVFSPDALEDAIIAFEYQPNDRNQRMRCKARAIWSRDDLRFKVDRALNSKGRPDMDTNDKNVLTGENLVHIKVPHITSATAWGLLGEKKLVRWFFQIREKMKTDRRIEFYSRNYEFIASEWLEIAALDWIATWGTTGA